MVHFNWIFAVLAIGACAVHAHGPEDDLIVIEGDIALTREQYMARKNHKWMMTADKAKRWKNATLYYTIAMTYYSERELEEMQWAFDQYEKETCLKFRHATPDTPNYIMVRVGSGGCNAQLGQAYSDPGVQTVNLGSGCRHYGLYLHEFGHSIGLNHEHQHLDRRLNIHWENVSDSMKEWFELERDPYLTYGAPYDVQSIMHYGETAFAKSDGLITMTTKDPKLQKYIHVPVWLKDMSFYDALKINVAYNCASHCKIRCPADTFVDKHCHCVTKQEFAKRRCINMRNDCPILKNKCESEKYWMWKYCRKTCGKCYEPI